MSDHKTYNTPDAALKATDKFYRNQSGFGYDLEKVMGWLSNHVLLPERGRVLDLCCGDGIWSLGIKKLNPQLELFGIEISEGGIERARKIVDDTKGQFVVGDVEKQMPFETRSFDLIFARGTGIYNQHDMSRPATVQLIEMWHEYLTDGGHFCGIYGSTPTLMGSYTPIDKVKLPYNRSPRHSDAVDFKGGKFHHTKESFQAPFLASPSIEIVDYKFVTNKHVLRTKRL